MSKKFLPLAGIAVVLAIVSYLVLSFAFPHKQEVAVDNSIKPDTVFGAAVDEAGSEPTAIGANQDDSLPEAQEVPVGAPDASTLEAETAALSDPNGEALEVDVTNPLPEDAVEVAASETSSEVPAEAATTSESEFSESAATSEVVSEPVAEAVPVEAAPVETAPVETAPVEVAQQEAPTSSPEPEVARTEPAPAPAKAAVAKAPSSGKAKPTARGKKLTGPDALAAWWTAPASGDFGVVYAGQTKGERTVALLFSTQITASALNDNIKVYDSKGKLVRGKWQAASANPRLALLRGLKPGRYTVVIGSTLVDASGKAISKAEHGPVYVI